MTRATGIDTAIDGRQTGPATPAAPVAAREANGADSGWGPLLSTAGPIDGWTDAGLRSRLLERVARAAAASRAFDTRRYGRHAHHPAPGVTVHELHTAAPAALRPGEPRRAWIIDLMPGAGWTPPAGGPGSLEWLVMNGCVEVDGVPLWTRSHRLAEPGAPGALHSAVGARLYFRESAAPVLGAQALASHDSIDAWQPYAPGVSRRVIYRDGAAAAMLYHASPGAEVPAHRHDHDEECLMLAGDLFLDDVLLRPGDYQLAPAGTRHGSVSTDTGAILYARGDLDLHVLAL